MKNYDDGANATHYIGFPEAQRVCRGMCDTSLDAPRSELSIPFLQLSRQTFPPSELLKKMKNHDDGGDGTHYIGFPGAQKVCRGMCDTSLDAA